VVRRRKEEKISYVKKKDIAKRYMPPYLGGKCLRPSK